MPIFIYSSLKFGVTPQINAISTIIVAVVSLVLFIAWRLGAFRPARPSLAVEDASAG
jgi:ABC-type spermidine/putrescine transport system permease subunit II